MHALRLVLLSVLLATAGSSQPPEGSVPWRLATDEVITERLRVFVDEQRATPGVVVGVFEAEAPPERRLRYFSAGTSGRKGLPLGPDVLFEVGSITKGFTGLLVGDLLARGEIRLDTTLAELVPTYPWPDEVARITVEELATHRSGLPRISLLPTHLVKTLLRRDPYAGFRTSDVWEAAARTPGRRPPGEALYSNLGYALLGRALAAHQGREYEELLRQRVLEPWGLTQAYLLPPEVPTAQAARGFRNNFRPSVAWNLDAYAPAGGLVTSARELTEFFAQVHATDSAMWRLATTSGRYDPSVPRSQTRLGWMMRPPEAAPLIWHNGGTGGFRTFAGYVPAEGIAVVVLGNGHGNIDSLAFSLLMPEREPPPASSRFHLAQGGPLAALVLAPLFAAWQVRPAAKRRRPRDRLDVALGLLGFAFLLVLAEAFGPWRLIPFVVWWFAAAITLFFAVRLVLIARRDPWINGAWWSRGLRMTGVALMGALVLLLV
jgi:CubicO group peptidase (beta-lactamase class C family)